MSRSAHGLHKAVGGIRVRWEAAMSGKCVLHSDREAVAAVAGWDHAHPGGACEACARYAEDHRYTVERKEASSRD